MQSSMGHRPTRHPLFVAVGVALLFSIAPVRAEYALGDEHAPVTIIEYASFSCRYCGQFHRAVFPLLKARHIDTGRVQFIYRHYPTSSAALRGAVAVHCAGPGRFYEMLDALYLTVGHWLRASDIDAALTRQAASLALDEARFAACLSDPRNGAHVRAQQQRAKGEHGVRGTPTFIINGQVVRGLRSIEALDGLIKQALRSSSRPSGTK